MTERNTAKATTARATVATIVTNDDTDAEPGPTISNVKISGEKTIFDDPPAQASHNHGVAATASIWIPRPC